MAQTPAYENATPPPNARNEQTVLHYVGRNIANELGLRTHELEQLTATPNLPAWQSSLRVAELAYDSVALASLALSLVGQERGTTHCNGRILPAAARIQASFGSEKLFRINGSAPSIWAALSGFWKVRDGWVRTHGNYPHHAERLAALLGISPQAERATVGAAMRPWSRFDLEARAAEVGALAIAVRDPSEWWQHPHYLTLERSPAVHYTSLGDARPRPWTATGELPLTGVRVLDLTRVIAGPVATRDLAVAGANVLRVDSPRLPEASWQHLDTAHQKRSTLLDFDERRDFTTLQQLLAEADVVVHGYRPTALAKYGLDVESLHHRFPGIVVAQLSAWGTQGPWGDRRGFDSLVQAASGIAVLESKDGGATPGALPVQALDHSAGHFLAATIATALRAQRTVGGSMEIEINLARIANELLAAGPPNASDGAVTGQDLPSQSVALATTTREAPIAITCAPPVLSFPGGPGEYRSALRTWGADEAKWIS